MVVQQSIRESALKQYPGVATRNQAPGGGSHNSMMNWIREEVADLAMARVAAPEIHTIEAGELWASVSQKWLRQAVVRR